MSLNPLSLPELPIWAQQLANILPLTVLIEFIDVNLKLHIFELNGQVPLWSWPVTPKGARLILSKNDPSAACCLDRPECCGTALQCIDGRYGDFYPSSAPTTVRLCVAALPVGQSIPNDSRYLEEGRPRIQSLDFLHVAPAESAKMPHRFLGMSRHASVRYLAVSTTGWLLWLATVAFCLLGSLYVAAAYLLLMPTVGVMAELTRGGKPRELDTTSSHYSRLIVAADSMNATDWMGFYGWSKLVNSFLNRALYRKSNFSLTSKITWITRGAILGQWVLALVSCTQQDWNALAISFWMFWCALTSEYALRPEDSVRDWLEYTCKIKIHRISARFSSRRAMLGTLIYLNPDTAENKMRWLNPILEDCPDRREWERVLLELIRTGECKDEEIKQKYCWGWIQESVEMGKKIKKALNQSLLEPVDVTASLPA